MDVIHPSISRKKFLGSLWILRLLISFPLLPLVLLYTLIKPKIIFRQIHSRKFRPLKIRDVGIFILRSTAVGLILFLMVPVWIAGYKAVGFSVADQFGYVAKNMTIVGTGSMYPTWAKGTKGKSPNELAKEIISTAGFLPYPNGIVINGKRFFGHTLQRGDIITWENDATRTLTSQDGGEPAGLLKRLIALPGDRLEIKDGIVYLNGLPQKEPYIAKPRSTFGEKFLEECKVLTVPEGEIFAMGDNRKGSADSREIGFAPISDIDYVLPLSKQKGELDKNWHEATNDLDDQIKPKIDKEKFVELFNIKRKEKQAKPVTYQSKLEKSAYLRGESIFKLNDFEQKSYRMEDSMVDAGYWNSYWWEVTIQGYYEAEELIEDYLERDWTDGKETWFDKEFDDIGIAEVTGTLNGCPTQIIIIQIAGYIPATYDQNVVESWKTAVNNLNSIIPSWEEAKGKGWVNESDLNRLLESFYRQKMIASRIFTKMEARQWLNQEDDNLIYEYERLMKESSDLAHRLNQR